MVKIIAVIFDFCSRGRLGRESNLHQGGRDGQKEGKGRGGVIKKKKKDSIQKILRTSTTVVRPGVNFFFVCLFSFSSDS